MLRIVPVQLEGKRGKVLLLLNGKRRLYERKMSLVNLLTKYYSALLQQRNEMREQLPFIPIYYTF